MPKSVEKRTKRQTCALGAVNPGKAYNYSQASRLLEMPRRTFEETLVDTGLISVCIIGKYCRMVMGHEIIRMVESHSARKQSVKGKGRDEQKEDQR